MFAYNVPFKDFELRRRNCQIEAKKRELSGVFVCSRGGGTFDRYAGGCYFANHYQQRCYLPDNLPLWSGRSHSMLLIPAEGESVLLVTTLEYRKDLVAIKDIRYAPDFHKLIADTAKELGMDCGDVGIIYEDTIHGTILRNMNENLPDLNLVPCDDIISNMQVIKTPREQTSIIEACRIGSEAVRLIMEQVAEGKTESEVLGPAMAHIYSNGAVLYFVVTNGGKDSTPVHSIDFPGYDCRRKMKNGDIFKVDLILIFEGYICDFGRTTVVGGEADPVVRRMIEEVTLSCEHVISKIKPGVKISEVVASGDEYLISKGIYLDAEQTDPDKIYAAFPPHWGHGIGMTWERPWFVKDETMVVEENMYLAVEKCLYKPGVGTVNYEQNFLVTADGVKILTTTQKLWI
jgi:Xaa-Pro aminopeptidase